MRVARRRLLGAAVILLAVGLTAWATSRSGQQGATEQTVWVRFDGLNGLAKVNRDVRIAGVDVGRIGEIRRVGDDADVELLLTGKAGPVYADATAELRPHAAFEGDAWVDLDPGTPAAGAVPETGIPKAQTSVYVPLDHALRVLDKPRRDAVGAATRELGAASTQRMSSSVRRTLGELPGASRAAATAMRAAQGPNGDELRSVIADLAEVAPELGARAPQVTRLVADVRRTLAAVNTQNRRPLDATLVALPGASRELQAGAETLPAMVGRVRKTARALGPTLRASVETLPSLRATMREATPVLADTPGLTPDIQRLLDDLAAATPATRALISAAVPALGNIEHQILPAMLRPSRLGQPTHVQFASSSSGFTAMIAGFHPRGARRATGEGHFFRVTADLRQAADSVTGGGAWPNSRCAGRLSATPQRGSAKGCRP